MFSYLKLENFKSFKSINVDFRGTRNRPKNLVFIYGENGSGKTNIVYALQFLKETITTLNIQEILFNFLENVEDDNKEDLIPFRLLNDLDKLKTKAYMIGSTEDMVLEYGFYLNGIEGYYKLIFGDTLKEESLYFQIDKNRGYIFNLTNESKELSKTIFYDTEYKNELENLIERFWGKHTFLSILNNEMRAKNQKYLKKRMAENLFSVINFFNRYSTKHKTGNFGETSAMGTKYGALLRLNKGRISSEEESQLRQKEELTRYFLTSVYSDIKDVYYKKRLIQDKQQIEYQLYVKKLIGNTIRDINFSLESTGTQNLLELLLPLVESAQGNVSIIDEADTGIHDILFNLLIENISDSIKGQLIITTHNTTLLEKLENENIYFILVDGQGNKEIVNVNDFEQRTQMNHNVRERYLKGMYGGIPIPGSLDFETIIEILSEDFSPDSGDEYE